MSKKLNKLKQQHGVNSQQREEMDFVFSAPKSVSIHGVYLQESGITEAHNKAVEETIKYMELIANDAERRGK